MQPEDLLGKVYKNTRTGDLFLFRKIHSDSRIEWENLRECKYGTSGARSILNAVSWGLLIPVESPSDHDTNMDTSPNPKPLNNDGRETCFACGAKTRPCGSAGWGPNHEWRVCMECGK